MNPVPSPVINQVVQAFTNRSRQQVEKRINRFARQQPHLRQLFSDLARLFELQRHENDFLVILSAMAYEMLRIHFGDDKTLPEIPRQELKDTFELLELEYESALQAGRERDWITNFISGHNQSEMLTGIQNALLEVQNTPSDQPFRHMRVGVLFLFTLVDSIDRATVEEEP